MESADGSRTARAPRLRRHGEQQGPQDTPGRSRLTALSPSCSPLAELVSRSAACGALIIIRRSFASPRRDAPESCSYFPPERGRGECRMPNAPAVSCAIVVIERTRVTTSTPESPGIPARNGFNGFLRALPGDRACLPPSPADVFCLSPVGPTQLRKLDASVGASGPHDFAVRSNIVRQFAV